MNKSQLTIDLAKRAGLSGAKAKQVVDALFDPATGLISAQLQEGGKLSLHEFGQFSTKDRPARKGRDPRTGKEIDVPARTSCAFQPRKGLRSSMKDIVGA